MITAIITVCKTYCIKRRLLYKRKFFFTVIRNRPRFGICHINNLGGLSPLLPNQQISKYLGLFNLGIKVKVVIVYNQSLFRPILFISYNAFMPATIIGLHK